MKKTLCVFVLIALSLTAVLAGCGGQTAGDASSGRKESNSVVVGISQDLDSLDPHCIGYAGTREVLFNLYEGLVKATSSGDVEPAVASDYLVSDDAKSITFTLRDGVKFWDGTPVTASDVVFSIERYAGLQEKSSAFSIFKGVEADGEKIVVNLSEPGTEFIYELVCAIIPATYGEDGTAPIGTGPFKFVSYTPGEGLKVERNSYYWKEGVPCLDAVTFKIITDADTALLQLNAGTIDIWQYLTSDQTSALQPSKFNIEVGNVNYVQAMFLNNAAEPFDDVKVRQALYYAVDRQMVSDMIFDGKSHVIGTNMIPAATKYYNTDTETLYSRDIEKAKQLLKEAGYGDGFEFTITVPNNYAPHESAAQIIVENLAEIGITANINLVEFTTWYSDVYIDRNYEATVVAVDGALNPSSWFVKNISSGVNNFTNYSNKEFDELYDKALAEADLDIKAKYYKQMQMILAEDAASIYLEDPSNLVAVNSQLEGYVFYPISAQDMSAVKYK